MELTAYDNVKRVNKPLYQESNLCHTEKLLF